MKNIIKFAISIIIFISLLLNTDSAYAFQTSFSDNANNTILNYKNSQDDLNHVSHQQSKAQVEFFSQALNELGATSPKQVVKLWVKAEQTRNGVFHYAVACDELKKKIIKEWGEPQENFWIIGVSSPWLDKYEILSNKKLNNSCYETTIKFFWITSAGPSDPTQNTLVIVKNKDIWCVKEVK